jgi:hypothetical protein
VRRDVQAEHRFFEGYRRRAAAGGLLIGDFLTLFDDRFFVVLSEDFRAGDNLGAVIRLQSL